MKKQITIEIDNDNAFNVAMNMIIVGAAEVIAITSLHAPIRANALDNKIRDFLRLASEGMSFTTEEAIDFAAHINKLLSLFR